MCLLFFIRRNDCLSSDTGCGSIDANVVALKLPDTVGSRWLWHSHTILVESAKYTCSGTQHTFLLVRCWPNFYLMDVNPFCFLHGAVFCILHLKCQTMTADTSVQLFQCVLWSCLCVFFLWSVVCFLGSGISCRVHFRTVRINNEPRPGAELKRDKVCTSEVCC